MEMLEIASQAAKEAGDLLLQGFETSFKIEAKEGKHNLVTEYDLLCQKKIIERISSAFPSHLFLAEEEDVTSAPSDEILWIIDPLDGTVNFAHGIPFFAVSIAAAKGNEILCGAIYCPTLGELFTAEKGAGAYLNQKKLSVNSHTAKGQALFSTGFPYNVDENPLGCIERINAMLKMGLPVRRFGVAALDLAYVAAGRYSVFWEVGLHSWDMAAGKLLIEEAGGSVTLYDGSSHPIYGYHPILATNGHLHNEMVSFLEGDIQ